MNNTQIILRTGEIIRCAPIKALPVMITQGRPIHTKDKISVWDLDNLEWRVVRQKDIVSTNELPEKYELI